jgi:hypothetical protein
MSENEMAMQQKERKRMHQPGIEPIPTKVQEDYKLL